MSNSSAPEVYSTILNDNIGVGSTGFIAQDISTVLPGAVTMYDTGNITTGNITISNGGSNSSNYYYHTGSTMTISSSGNVGIGTISGISASTFQWKNSEFIDAFPDYNKVQKMCEQYPGLRIAYEKFVTTYKLVKDDYDTPEDQRPKP
jgi:hypothetical protein